MSADATAPEIEMFRARTRARRRARIWATAIGLPVALVALVLVAKLLSMHVFAHQAIASFARSDAASTIQAAEGQRPFNIVERWKAPYNLGVGYAIGERLPEARAEFESALDLATGLDVCPVRINLALVIERMGDDLRQSRPAEAAELYDEALLVTLETPDECRSDEAQRQSPDPERDPSVSLDGLEERLTQKEQEPQPQPDDTDSDENDGDQPEQPREPDQNAIDELEQKLEDGAREREQHVPGDDDGEGSGAERPW